MHDNSSYGYMVDTKTGEILQDCNILGKLSMFFNHLEKYHASHTEDPLPLNFKP